MEDTKEIKKIINNIQDKVTNIETQLQVLISYHKPDEKKQTDVKPYNNPNNPLLKNASLFDF